MKKKETTISIDRQTVAQETVLIGLPNSTSESKDTFLNMLDKVILTDKTEEKSAKGKEKTSE
jgi:hypothetical protein